MAIVSQGFGDIENLSDLNLSTAPTEGDIITYNDSSSSWDPAPPVSKSFMNFSGRIYCYPDNRWISTSDDNYGQAYYQFAEPGGTGATPLLEWEHLGTPLPPGVKITKLHFTGRTNNIEVSDLRLYAVIKKPTPITRWETGIDADVEVETSVIYDDSFYTPAVGTAFTGNTNDLRGRSIDIDATTTDLSFLSLYVKPTGTNTATRYFPCSWTWEFEYQ